MIRTALAATLAFAAAMPAAAQDDIAPDLAESRLRGCLLAGASAAPATGLREAVISVRAFCKPQIDRVQRIRVGIARQGLSGQRAQDAEDAAVRALNDEIALAVSNFTGLTTL